MKRGTLQKLIVAGLLSVAPGFAAAGSQGAAVPSAQTPGSNTVSSDTIRKALNNLTWYGVFDNLDYAMDNAGNVTLTGEVTRYSVRNDAVSTIKHLPGVNKVIDKIEILPLSPYDDNIRVRAYKAIYQYPALSMYVVRGRQPIRIIVNHGEVTLVGAVASEMDRRIVFDRVSALPGTLKVTNDLIIN